MSELTEEQLKYKIRVYQREIQLLERELREKNNRKPKEQLNG